MQAANFLKKVAHYTVESVPFAEVVLAMRKSILSAHAGLNLLVVDITIWHLLPSLLILAAISALVIEVRHTVVTYRLQVATHMHTKPARSLPDTCISFTAGRSVV
jgi:hypothetical protein